MSHKRSFVVDQRGAVAFETLIVYPVLVAFLLMPLADLAAAGFQFISAWSALRSFGQYVQYANPLAPDGTVSWKTGLQTTVAGHAISNLQVLCGDAGATCSPGNLASPKYITFSTTITLAPIVWRGVLCPTTCTYTLPYSERFQ
ncbi:MULTISPECIES: hypothetical protein [unclassified Bradyrhizobium]|uniref:hypothetical protein n=1 Tax=unclassified Bradyrhizobium TaxID=2631580 RepID=UPI000676552B|nr:MULTISPECIES: hypothetical protein [unclassified Bradyrhizobium]MBB4262992.1 hypothetical protein [Bradyrhizobium sp. CIR3A]MBB4361122.1 hypothetical protein [Bradyrhizobium sp. CIR18]MBB4377209.1 hypothetical protein [Bradyrhizobium sp. SBR1B]MBB4398057.1 hypothetical protein [Bradyrhizobium sp. ERR14]MBB4423385.1 hypothetical protein [Bradyrhizobium sp. CIR48]